ncbi:ATP-dependent protease LA-related protein, putative [Babesia ovata]|uniref:ATP-dependent protease LA-related protein, putative n=1 Tax=Babesia ovata TaxID=189622 RepID=A0A2H6KGK2_9APIC|nr:ATP-dependent protease LA-related protein, putative [Babesia ovata]GBE62123.1 ATP-dependent protease LA-related protein, putative [Babesia ovata]
MDIAFHLTLNPFQALATFIIPSSVTRRPPNLPNLFFNMRENLINGCLISATKLPTEVPNRLVDFTDRRLKLHLDFTLKLADKSLLRQLNLLYSTIVQNVLCIFKSF